jgi:response regulator RpfG family c-di-GMP phosphodiesterase
MSPESRPRILCVDDEPYVLDGLERVLRRSFETLTVADPESGLRLLERDEQLAAVVSDLRMPRMDGIAFLEQARRIRPDAVRLLLTGDADLQTALDAVNRGAVFRFLIKPSTPEALRQAVSAAVEQHRLITAERTLLEQTLRGSIRALTEVLALTNPAGFGRAARVEMLARTLAGLLEVEGRWQIEVAAMLSQIGTVTLPRATVEKLYGGMPLSYAEEVCVQRLPQLASDLLASIPRLEAVQEILLHQNARFDGAGSPPSSPTGTRIPLGARLLKVVLDFDLLESQGLSRGEAIETLRGRSGWYDPHLLEVLAEFCARGAAERLILETELRAVRPGMVFVEDVVTPSGVLLIARGQEASERLMTRIHNLAHLEEARQRVRVSTTTAPGGR